MEEKCKQELTELAEKILNEQGQEEVEELLDDDEEILAQMYLLGALDRAVHEKDLSFEEAAGFYKTLGVSKKEAVARRQAHATKYG